MGNEKNRRKPSISIREAIESDADQLVLVRKTIDTETENMDRTEEESTMTLSDMKELIDSDRNSPHAHFLVAEVEGKIVGFSRCAGSSLSKLRHQVEFGVGVVKAYWGYGIGKQLLNESLAWAQHAGKVKMTLNVLDTNEKAIRLYERLGFETEGVLRADKKLADGKFYNTIVMGKLLNCAGSEKTFAE
ncbi:GNAT family N-acetyltransferase [Paenisporosarcina cavernae]|uniref:GNAT family N-acetyltransferase n=1 Tax=Paenisporosarcina cavernae TaxID=2320858 RepID=A0A385YX90_9BACL|nr:GNAT family N-acetyltransferase [Paenisporosarcina cavernae]AYC30527.1 GNAT family N-acetyltransferase [Paenisporosarcina cavernae]